MSRPSRFSGGGVSDGCVGGWGNPCGVGEQVELRVELANVMDMRGEPLVVERSVVREGKGCAAEVGEGEAELVPELAFAA